MQSKYTSNLYQNQNIINLSLICLWFVSGLSAWEGSGCDRGERGVQQHTGRCVGDHGQHTCAPQEQNTQRKTGVYSSILSLSVCILQYVIYNQCVYPASKGFHANIPIQNTKHGISVSSWDGLGLKITSRSCSDALNVLLSAGGRLFLWQWSRCARRQWHL